MDQACVDFAWLSNLDSTGIVFVTRLKRNADIAVVEPFLTNAKREHFLNDEDIRMTGFYNSWKCSGTLRMRRVYDAENDQTLMLLTNQMSWMVDTISPLYQARWGIEVFFKHLKQLFRVKTFVGTSPNAVRIQMWSSMMAMLLMPFLKSKAQCQWYL